MNRIESVNPAAASAASPGTRDANWLLGLDEAMMSLLLRTTATAAVATTSVNSAVLILSNFILILQNTNFTDFFTNLYLI